MLAVVPIPAKCVCSEIAAQTLEILSVETILNLHPYLCNQIMPTIREKLTEIVKNCNEALEISQNIVEKIGVAEGATRFKKVHSTFLLRKSRLFL